MSGYFDGKNGRLSKTGRSSLRGELLELKLLPFLPGNHKEFLR